MTDYTGKSVSKRTVSNYLLTNYYYYSLSFGQQQRPYKYMLQKSYMTDVLKYKNLNI